VGTRICYDNAAAESFWATLKKELIHLHAFADLKQLRAAVFDYIDAYCNRRRLHSKIGYRAPVEFEAEFDRKKVKAA